MARMDVKTERFILLLLAQLKRLNDHQPERGFKGHAPWRGRQNNFLSASDLSGWGDQAALVVVVVVVVGVGIGIGVAVA